MTERCNFRKSEIISIAGHNYNVSFTENPWKENLKRLLGNHFWLAGLRKMSNAPELSKCEFIERMMKKFVSRPGGGAARGTLGGTDPKPPRGGGWLGHHHRPDGAGPGNEKPTGGQTPPEPMPNNGEGGGGSRWGNIFSRFPSGGKPNGGNTQGGNSQGGNAGGGNPRKRNPQRGNSWRPRP